MSDLATRTDAHPVAAEPEAKPSFLRRRVVVPLLQQIRQGATPVDMARSVAWGAWIGVFPILGTTTTLCAVAGFTLRLNHIALQTVNWLVYPLQFLLIIPFLQLGNMLFGLDPVALSLSEIASRFDAGFLDAARDMGWLALRAIAAWALLAGPCILAMRWVLTPVFRHAANVMTFRGRSS